MLMSPAGGGQHCITVMHLHTTEDFLCFPEPTGHRYSASVTVSAVKFARIQIYLLLTALNTVTQLSWKVRIFAAALCRTKRAAWMRVISSISVVINAVFMCQNDFHISALPTVILTFDVLTSSLLCGGDVKLEYLHNRWLVCEIRLKFDDRHWSVEYNYQRIGATAVGWQRITVVVCSLRSCNNLLISPARQAWHTFLYEKRTSGVRSPACPAVGDGHDGWPTGRGDWQHTHPPFTRDVCLHIIS